MSTDPLNLDPIKARADKATPGPWHIGNAVDPTWPCNVHSFPGARGVADNVGWLDAEFIAAARTDVPALVAEIQHLRTQLADITDGGEWEYGVRWPKGGTWWGDGTEHGAREKIALADRPSQLVCRWVGPVTPVNDQQDQT